MASREVDLPADLVEWVEGEAGGAVRAAASHVAGASRSAWNVDVEGAAPLFLLRDRNDRGGSARDAAVLRALAGSVVPVPRVIAQDEKLRVLLLERLDGSSEFPIEDDARANEETARALMGVAAALHRLDPAALEIDHLERPSTLEETVQPALDAIRSAREVLGHGLDPFFDLALRWLERGPTGALDEVALVHSDFGPGNFLHRDHRITGIVDWEVAHFGDPMEDLAALAVRDMATPVGSLLDRYREYEEAGGGPVDLERVRYFQLLVLVRNSAMIRMGIEHGGPEVDVSEMTMFETLLLRGAALVLCDAVGVARPKADEGVVVPDDVRAADVADLRVVFGDEAASGDANAAIRRAASDAVPVERAVTFFARRAHRRAAERRDLLGPLMGRLPQRLPTSSGSPS